MPHFLSLVSQCFPLYQSIQADHELPNSKQRLFYSNIFIDSNPICSQCYDHNSILLMTICDASKGLFCSKTGPNYGCAKEEFCEAIHLCNGPLELVIPIYSLIALILFFLMTGFCCCCCCCCCGGRCCKDTFSCFRRTHKTCGDHCIDVCLLCTSCVALNESISNEVQEENVSNHQLNQPRSMYDNLDRHDNMYIDARKSKRPAERLVIKTNFHERMPYFTHYKK